MRLKQGKQNASYNWIAYGKFKQGWNKAYQREQKQSQKYLAEMKLKL